MPFRLKNTGAMYQRMINKMLQHQVEKNIEIIGEELHYQHTLS